MHNSNQRRTVSTHRTRRCPILSSATLSILLLATVAVAEDDVSPAIIERSASLSTLFPADRIDALSQIIAPDREIRWSLYVPRTQEAMGVVVFMKPDRSASPPGGWTKVLDERNLIWVSAQHFGNSVPVRQRILAGIMGLTYVQQHYPVDPSRVYIAGMSGGGRVASIAITEFPQLFSGALYIVGVNFWEAQAQARLDQIRRKRYVFLTGNRDFNRDETRAVYHRYREEGVTDSLLMDLPHFGHEYPNAAQFENALRFLDAHHTPASTSSP